MASLGDILTADVWWKALFAVIGIALPLIWGSLQRLKISQEEIFHREAHNLSLFERLAHPNGGVQVSAATVLTARLEQRPKKPFEIAERKAIIKTLISVTKHEGTSVEVCKIVADDVLKALDVLDRPKGSLGRRSAMRNFDWQGVRLYNGYWRGIDARGVDFFRARLVDVGMRNAHLSGAIFKEAILRKCVLTGADLQGADLRGADLRGSSFDAANLQGAKLEGAKYDETTTFPDGFDPDAALMVRAKSVEMAA
jgi:hypothetical protein